MLFEDIKWMFRTWRWAENQVAKRLVSVGYHVVKNFYVYDPIRKKYAEVDVLGIAGDHIIQVEVKTWQGKWNIGDQYKGTPVWYKQPYNFKARSPVAQAVRARTVLTNVINQSFFKEDYSVDEGFIRSIVLFERGSVMNLHDDAVRPVLAKKRVFVRGLSNLNERSIENQFPTPLLNRFSAYQNNFKWRWYFKYLKKVKWKNKEVLFMWYLEKLQRKWEVYLSSR